MNADNAQANAPHAVAPNAQGAPNPAANANNNAPAANQNAAAVVFALTPAAANPGIIDYTTVAGRKMKESCTKKLTEELFDCVPENLFTFLKALKDRARDLDWNGGAGILDIVRNPANVNSPSDDLLEAYGNISLESVKTYEMTYINRPVRPAQDTYNLYLCLMNSMSEVGKSKVLIWEREYTVGGYVSGPLLLKVMIRESHLDTNATTGSIREKLSSLDLYLPTVGCNVTKFNQYVKLMIQALGARGETTQDLLSNLFKGYSSCSDQSFVTYIMKKQDEYDEGQAMTSDQLMLLADNKYKNLLLKNKWNAPSEHEEKILALEAKINALQNKRKRGGGGAGKYVRDPKKQFAAKPEWMKEAPGIGANARVWKDKLWHYCHPSTGGKCDGQWRIHKPADCKGKANSAVHFQAMQDKRKAKSEEIDSKKDKKLKLASAYQATLDHENADFASQTSGDTEVASESEDE